jgi:AraC-like DNA-binding protein
MSDQLIPLPDGVPVDLKTAKKGFVQVASLLGILPLLRERGINPADVLVSVGLGPSALDDARNVITYQSAGQLLQRCSDVTGCAHFGLLVGQQANLSTLGILGELMRRSPNVQAALRSLLLHMRLKTRGGMPTHTVEGGYATLGYAVYQRDVRGTVQGHDLAVAFEFNILRSLCGPRWRATEVFFSHTKPKNVRPYLQYFHARLHFDAGRTAIVFGKTWLDHAPPDSDATLHRALARELATQDMLEPEEITERIRRALRTMIVSGGASESMISYLLSISTRTLRRALAAQGTTFRRLLEDIRYEIARQLLADSHISINEIADLLDYGHASAFTRAFQRWTNSSPAAWRAKMVSAASVPGSKRISTINR